MKIFEKYRYTIGIAGLIAAAGIWLISCNNDNENATVVTMEDVVNNYADIVYANYLDAYNKAEDMETALIAFVDAPSDNTLAAAKSAWLDARKPYGQSEVYRFYAGPIDDDDGPEGQLNAWPLDESYIDYVDGNVNGGENNDGTNIINSPGLVPTIDKATLISLNEQGGETNITTGYHAIEFLLWGQDLSTDAGGGERPVSDYVVSGDDSSPEARRGVYLKTVASLILDDLQSLLDEWQPGGNYRTSFTVTAEIENSFEKMLIGMGKLSKGELAGERMFVAWDEKSKEDEHSCFSDNTHNDIYYNALGIQNVYLGQYTRSDGTTLDGPGIDELVKQNDEALYTTTSAIATAAITAVQAIQAPFDQEFLDEPGRTRVKEAIDILRSQGDKIAEISALFGFVLNPSDI